ncbi:MAG: dihydrodipicolinate synthase family protein [Pseudolabrys sp.]
MAQRKFLTSMPRGIIDVPVTPFTPENKLDLDTFARVIEFLLRHNASSLCINLHLAESLNLTLEERKQLAKAAVEVTAGRVSVIVHVSTPGTDQAAELARHAEQVGADCVIAIAPYYWKPSQEQLYDHFAAIIDATELPFIAYSSPTIMDGVGIAPSTLVALMQRYPKFIGLKEASHNWEKYLELGRAAKTVRPDFGLFVGTEWMVPCLTLGGTACMSVFGGIAPRFIKALYDATTSGDLKKALDLQYKFSELYQIAKVEYPAPTKAMWEIMGRPVGAPRLPNRPLTAERKKEIKATLERLGLYDSEPHGW